jgi:protein associated with RNAse G/E
VQVKWFLHTPPVQGHATVSEDGVLFYKPVRDRYGTDTLHVKMLEYDLPDVMTPLESKHFA